MMKYQLVSTTGELHYQDAMPYVETPPDVVLHCDLRYLLISQEPELLTYREETVFETGL